MICLLSERLPRAFSVAVKLIEPTRIVLRKGNFIAGLCCWILLVCLPSVGRSTQYIDQTTEFSEHTRLFSPELSDIPSFNDEKGHQTDARFSWSGYFKLSSSYHFDHDEPQPDRTDFRGVNALKSSMLLRLDMDLSPTMRAMAEGYAFYDFIYHLRGRHNYTDTVKDRNESDAELFNCYLEARLSERLDLKLGRQVVVWGKSDSFRVTDVLNPVDYTEPGRGDLSELRLPVLMGKLDMYFPPYHVSVIVAPERRWNKYPVFGSSFYPFNFPVQADDGSSITFKDMDFALALSGSFSAWDLSLYAAHYTDKAPFGNSYFSLPLYQLNHAEVNMAGADADVAWKNFLFKAEGAYFSGIRYTDFYDAGFGIVRLSGKTYEKAELLCGMEYLGFKNTYLVIEAVTGRVIDYDGLLDRAGISRHTFQASAKLIYSFFNDRGTLNIQSAFEGENAADGAIHRIKLGYDLSDHLRLSGGLVFYESGRNILYKNLGKNDMVFLDLIFYY